MSATAFRIDAWASVVSLLLDQITSFHGLEYNHAGSHHERQHKHDGQQGGTAVPIVSCPSELNHAGSEDNGQRERQSSAPSGEFVEHQGRFHRRAQTGNHGKFGCSAMFRLRYVTKGEGWS